MNTIVDRILKMGLALAAVLAAACTADETTREDEALLDGMGRLRVCIAAPENAAADARMTRAVRQPYAWEDPDHDWERVQSYRILVCRAATGGKYVVAQVISGTEMTDVAHTPEGNVGTPNSGSSTHRAATVTSAPLPAGTYYVFATANYADGYEVGQELDPERTVLFPNGYSASSDNWFGEQRSIPMTGRLLTAGGSALRAVSVVNGTVTDVTDTPLALWRTVAKLQFEFVNESASELKILGIEVDPINRATTTGVYLFSKDNLESEANLAPGATPPAGQEGLTLPAAARQEHGAVRHEPAAPLELAAHGDGTDDEGSIFFYVNESDATFTTTANQYSLRFKVQRDGYTEELRYGMTTQHDLTTGGIYGGTDGGFNVIRRNDWVHIPVHLTDWQLRVEPLAFVPIGGYPATMLSSDALTATFSTGGMIALQPFVKKYTDATWRDFNDAEVTLDGISWKNSDGTNVAGVGKIVKTAFAYDPVSKCLIGELNNDLPSGTHQTTITLNVKLGPAAGGSQYDYNFTFNVVVQKP